MDIKRVDLINQLVENYGYTKKAATNIVDDFTSVVIDNIRSGNTVSIHNFGCFDILKRAARSCKSPKTKEKINIPEHYIPRFYPGKGMRAAVKMWEDDISRGMV